jgi:hypothetical protein
MFTHTNTHTQTHTNTHKHSHTHTYIITTCAARDERDGAGANEDDL